MDNFGTGITSSRVGAVGRCRAPASASHRPITARALRAKRGAGVTWIKLDQGFPEHPKLIEAGPVAAWLHVRALGYCNRNLTDGAISYAIARELAPGKAGQSLVRKLVAAGLWEITRTGYAIHDFLEYQP